MARSDLHPPTPLRGASDQTIISRGTRVNARVSGSGDLEIQGHVDGEVSVTGEVIVTAEGLCGASISARRITIRGAVRGDLIADEAVHLEDGARVVGDIRSARIAIAPGALLKGYVQTGGTTERRVEGKRAQPKPAPRVEPRKPEREAPKPVPAAAPSRRRTGVLAIAGGGGGGRKKGPPPPVVPVLKKGAKGALKKKA